MNQALPIQIIVNGEPQQLAESTTVSAFINQLELTAGRLAIEYNRDILPRAQWPETILRDGDKLEIVHFVGGG